MSPTLVAALAVALAFGWAALAAAGRWDLRVASVALAVLAPLAADPLLAQADKHVFALAAAAPLPGLVVSAWRRRGDPVRVPGALGAHPLLPFTALYAAAGAYGLAWGLARGNEPLLAAGQTWAAALFALGFLVAGPILAARARLPFWAILLTAIGVLSLPGLLPVTAWLGGAGDANLVRFLGRAALLAPIGALVALVVIAPRHRRAGILTATLFGAATVLTFTRSYWLGLAAGLAVLGALAIAGLAGGRLRPRVTPAGAAFALVLAGALVTATLALGLHGPVVERVAVTQVGAGDLSVDTRRLELAAALDALRAEPLLGIGSGGEFLSVHPVSPDEVALGPTNFIHNAYVYLPLKFGVLGFAALIALAGGTALALMDALRRARHEGVERTGMVAVLAMVLVASATAPNLIDPAYAVLIGALAYGAGHAHPEPVAAVAPVPAAPAAHAPAAQAPVAVPALAPLAAAAVLAAALAVAAGAFHHRPARQRKA